MEDIRFEPRPLIKRLRLRNYRSVGRCEIDLHALTILVGPNGSGKSNIIDSLSFVRDALRDRLEYAFRHRGGIDQVRRRSSGHPHNIAVELELNLPDNAVATYKFEIGSAQSGGFSVRRESCDILAADGTRDHFEVESGSILRASEAVQASVKDDRLLLGLISGLPPFRPLYDALTDMVFCNINPDALRQLQNPDSTGILTRDGGNLPSIVRQLPDAAKHRIEEYLAAIVPGVAGFSAKSLGPKETIEFRQEVQGATHPWRFLADSMSDGTLRALGLLVAMFQDRRRHGSFVAIEEPESALHPGAAFTLTEAILEAAETGQILISTHSPELLEHEAIGPENLVAVESRGGNTIASEVNAGACRAIRKRLMTAGELQRREQLSPEPRQEPATQQGLPFGTSAS
jgi:predicted ATPase